MRVLVQSGESYSFHLDSLDLCNAKHRQSFIGQAHAETRLDEQLLKRDLGQVYLKVEELQEKYIREATEPRQKEVVVPDAERTAAMELLKDPKLLDRILADFDRCGVVGEQVNKLVGYLEHVRHVPATLLASERFKGRIRIDERGNAVFPHWNHEGLCGFELKNEGFTGFAPGGIKGLWGSGKSDDDQQLVIAETAIDALGYAALFGIQKTRFLSTAGTMNGDQPDLIRRAVKKLPPGGLAIAAVDNDEAGDVLLARLRRELHGVEIIDDRPEQRGQDWNDVLRGHGQSR